jgi:hypothetical protein
VRSGGKDTRRKRRRATPLQVFGLEERTLLSVNLSPASTRGVLAAPTARVAESRSFSPAGRRLKQSAPPPTLTPIERLGYYNPTTQEFEQLVDVNNYTSLLQGKDVYVLVHGWAPGYINWVQNYAKKYDQVLEWWQTIPSNYPGGTANKQYQAIKKLDTDNAGPASPWLLDGSPYPPQKGDTVVASNGMAEDLVATDPNAVVLAYSWIDDSATSTQTITIPLVGYKISIPQDAYHSEALTTENGARLAVALEQALGPQTQFQGKLQLIGHSHGSKVVTVAADLLTTAPSADRLTVNQLTTLDSPESDSYGGSFLAEAGATNDNWYFMQDLNISKTPTPTSTSTFVDNYISAFDEPYDVISYTKSGVPSNPDLSQVTDVDLYAWPLIENGDFEEVHTYAAEWYGGSAESGVTYGQKVGRMWSPLLADSAPVPAQSFNEQAWDVLTWKASEQYELTTPYFPPSTIAPQFTPVTLSPVTRTPRVKVSNNSTSGSSVTLTQQSSNSQTYIGKFTASAEYFSGLTFNYQFTNSTQGDALNIYEKTNDPNHPWDLAFTMNPFLIQPQPQPETGSQPAPLKGTISLANPSLSLNWSHTLKFTLTSPTANSTSSVTVSNLMQYSYNILSGKPRIIRGKGSTRSSG